MWYSDIPPNNKQTNKQTNKTKIKQHSPPKKKYLKTWQIDNGAADIYQKRLLEKSKINVFVWQLLKIVRYFSKQEQLLGDFFVVNYYNLINRGLTFRTIMRSFVVMMKNHMLFTFCKINKLTLCIITIF